MKKHIEDLCNALYKRDLTVAVEEDTPTFPAVWTLAHPYFTLPLTIAFHNAHDTGPRTAVCQLRLLLNGKARNIAVFHQNQPPFVAA